MLSLDNSLVFSMQLADIERDLQFQTQPAMSHYVNMPILSSFLYIVQITSYIVRSRFSLLHLAGLRHAIGPMHRCLWLPHSWRWRLCERVRPSRGTYIRCSGTDTTVLSDDGEKRSAVLIDALGPRYLSDVPEHAILGVDENSKAV